jgi:hypothetical protein
MPFFTFMVCKGRRSKRQVGRMEEEKEERKEDSRGREK